MRADILNKLRNGVELTQGDMTSASRVASSSGHINDKVTYVTVKHTLQSQLKKRGK
ncbi:hypothetical protein bthur0007_49700 [Bacillus thuringiensis serovar monterrey BGSC 4AJ1]|nr:hypothetical protein bthur0007_49700 [Bacillus thuringiensis serovar monterrey BGSC 4AJ1]